MQELLSQIGVGAFIAIIAILGSFLIPIVAIVGAFTYKHRRLSVEAALKHDMLDRGMSAEEIERVLGASLSRKWKRRHCSSAYAAESTQPKSC
jgi:hypothetical protein